MFSPASITAKYHESGCPSLSSGYELLSQLSSVGDSMNFITNAFSPRPRSAKSHDSSSSQDNLAEDTGTETHAEDVVERSNVPTRPLKKPAGPRSRTSFQLRHPPPTTKQKQRLSIKPKVLLQLHRTSQITRPTPTFDVLSSGAVHSRLAKKFPQTFKNKAGAGGDGLAVVVSDNYPAEHESTQQGEDFVTNDRWQARDIIAGISQVSPSNVGGQRRAEICLSQQATWSGYTMPKGGYEFVTTDGYGRERIARWVPRKSRRRKDGSMPQASSHASSEQWGFNFSLIDPSSRRHAVIATMDTQSIDVFDTYTKPINHSPELSPVEATHTTSTDAIAVDDALRTLIVVTGVWIAFCEDFGLKPENSLPVTTESTAPEPIVGHKRRSLSLNLTRDRSAIVPFQSDLSPALSARPSLQKNESTPIMPTTPLISRPCPAPRRAQSVNSAFLKRAHSHRNYFRAAAVSDRDCPLEDESTTDESLGTPEAGSIVSLPQRQGSAESSTSQNGKQRKSKGFRRFFGSTRKESKKL